jgi:hypothetical protein
MLNVLDRTTLILVSEMASLFLRQQRAKSAIFGRRPLRQILNLRRSEVLKFVACLAENK